MALVQLSGIVSNIKGSIGGTTFSAIRAGTIAKKRVPGKRLLNTKQAIALNYSLLSTYAWVQLSNAQKIVFNNYALANASTDRYGVVKQLTGFQWFKILNQNSLYFTGSGITAPPAYGIPLPPPSFTVTLASDEIEVTWSLPIDITNYFWFCYTTPPIRGNARLQRGAYRITDVRGIDISTAFDLRPYWNEAHNLDYDAIAASGQFNINVLFFPVKISSLVGGTAQATVGSLY